MVTAEGFRLADSPLVTRTLTGQGDEKRVCHPEQSEECMTTQMISLLNAWFPGSGQNDGEEYGNP